MAFRNDGWDGMAWHGIKGSVGHSGGVYTSSCGNEKFGPALLGGCLEMNGVLV